MIDELLVHISAPTTRQSDELYQSLAEAYLNFEPHKHQSGSPRQDGASNRPVPSRLNDAVAPNQDSSFRSTADISILSTGKDSYGSFPSHLSLDGLRTPRDSTGRFDYNALGYDLPPTSGLQGHLQDSYLMSSDNAPGNDAAEDPVQDDTIEASVAETPDTKDGLPGRRRSMRLKAASKVAETPMPTLKLSANPNITTQPPRTADPDKVWESSLLASQHMTNKEKDLENNGQVTQPIDFSKLQIDVSPPEPRISIAQHRTLPSQVTPSLVALKRQNPTCFKPIRVVKKPKPDDRGYWLMSCSHWTAQLQQMFWSNICEQVSSGKLGWGVMLYREGGTSRSLGKVKLYCWGEIVEHTWLVLWLCSKGKVSGSGLEWVDADGNAAFVMS
jgi:hypothetical protein